MHTVQHVVTQPDYAQVAIGLAWLAIAIMLAAGGAVALWRRLRHGRST